VPRYAYDATDPSGKLVQGVLMADTERALDMALDEMNLVLIEARVERRRRAASVGPHVLIDFCYHLQSVIEGGIPIVAGLSDFCEDDKHPLAPIMTDVVRKLRNGAQLSAALGDYPSCFPDLMRALIRAGEETGKLDVILKDLVHYLEWREELRYRIRSAMAYPCVVVLGIVALCVLLVTYVLPSFLVVFVEMNVELPALTRGLLVLSEFLTQHGAWVVGGTAGFVTTFVLVIRTQRGRYAYHSALLRIPLIGRLLTMLEMSRFSHNLAVLYSAGIPIIRAMQMIAEIVQNVRIRRVIEEAEDSVGRGGSLTESLAREQIIPSLVMRMISIGEMSGELDQSLERASAYYDRELPRIISKTLAAFNTLAIVCLGGALAAVAISIFVPVYKMLGEING
jgi:general secretion pathway protein F